MKDLRLKLKRQTEIIGLVLSNPRQYKMADFEIIFNVQHSTLKRDMQEIRSWGIDIHSFGKSGLEISNKIPNEVIKEILPQYIGIAVSKNSHDSASNLMVRKLKEKAIEYVVILQLAIENHTKIKISYNKKEDSEIEERIIEPYCLFQSDKTWRLLANHNGVTKQFIVNRIKNVSVLKEKYKPLKQSEIDDIFKTSFKSWLGDERYNVKLKFLPPWPDRIGNRQLMEVQELTKEKDGSVIYETTVNSLNEIASWIVSRGKGVIVIEPEKLKLQVVETANGVLENYKK